MIYKKIEISKWLNVPVSRALINLVSLVLRVPSACVFFLADKTHNNTTTTMSGAWGAGVSAADKLDWDKEMSTRKNPKTKVASFPWSGLGSEEAYVVACASARHGRDRYRECAEEAASKLAEGHDLSAAVEYVTSDAAKNDFRRSWRSPEDLLDRYDKWLSSLWKDTLGDGECTWLVAYAVAEHGTGRQ